MGGGGRARREEDVGAVGALNDHRASAAGGSEGAEDMNTSMGRVGCGKETSAAAPVSLPKKGGDQQNDAVSETATDAPWETKSPPTHRTSRTREGKLRRLDGKSGSSTRGPGVSLRDTWA